MEHLHQLDNSTFPEFAIKNMLPILPFENDDCFEGIINDGKKYHRCVFPSCGKTFRYQSELKRHQFSHTMKRPISCPFPGCGKKFKHEGALRGHIRTHTGETPYMCEEPGCGKSFLNRGALRYHMLMHKGEKEYRCSFSECNKAFWTMGQLRQHENANYHQKISSSMLYCESQECLKVRKENESSNEDYVAVEDKTINKREIMPIELVNDNFEVYFSRIVKLMMNENDAMKKKLAMYEKLSGVSQEKEGMEDNFQAFSEPQEKRQFSTQESSEERILQFLKFNEKGFSNTTF